MFSDVPNEHEHAEGQQEAPLQAVRQLPLLPFAVQLQNIFPIKLVAERFPIDKAVDMSNMVSAAHTQLDLSDPAIDADVLQAQVHLEVRVNFLQEPRPFEIYFRLVGIFSYPQEYQPEMVSRFLQQGSLSVMLPSARETLLSLCTRLQVPMVVLPLVQVSPSQPSSEAKD